MPVTRKCYVWKGKESGERNKRCSCGRWISEARKVSQPDDDLPPLPNAFNHSINIQHNSWTLSVLKYLFLTPSCPFFPSVLPLSSIAEVFLFSRFCSAPTFCRNLVFFNINRDQDFSSIEGPRCHAGVHQLGQISRLLEPSRSEDVIPTRRNKRKRRRKKTQEKRE